MTSIESAIMPVIRSIVLAAALALPAAALAQPGAEHIQPGTPLDTTFIAPRTDSVAILEGQEGDTLVAGYAVMETRTHVVDGVRRVVHVQRLVIEGYPDPFVADSAHLHWSTLLPISAHTRGDTPTTCTLARGACASPRSLDPMASTPPAATPRPARSRSPSPCSTSWWTCCCARSRCAPDTGPCSPW
ncbi:MAG TPA: hypothetical protein VFQ76_17315 [Longimicrobiaceae bacterium]|nr:hypothetical protein [Longimicrobiaceae bacterium]